MSLGQSFVLPEAFVVLIVLVPLAWITMRLLDRARARRLERMVGPRAHLLGHELAPGQRRVRRALTLVGLLLALTAVLQPMWGEGYRRTEQRGVEILIALDVSRSMLANDVAPSRLEAAHREIRALAEHVHGDRLGLVAFAGEARLVVPLTSDTVSFADLVDTTGPLTVERGGTDLGVALTTALEALSGRSGAHESIVLVTDGEDLAGSGLAVARSAARERGITVHCVGFGSARGSKIAISGDGAPGGEAFLRDRTGAEVISVMDPASLGRIAEATGGDLVDANRMPLPLVELYEKRILHQARKAFESDSRRERMNRYQWPLLGAFLLWIVELCVSDRRRRRR